MDFIALQTALAGQYFLERELGRGGMGVVYLARETRLDRPVAIKVLPPTLAAHPGLRERFLREARTAAKLAHPNVVPVYRVDEAEGFVFLVMAYVDGGSLGDRIRERGTLPPSDVVRVVRDVGWALAYAHARGVVHRDVKPDNILLDRTTGRALVTDFGVAVLINQGGDAVPLTDEGLVMGTAHYMSPEQAAGEPLDGRSDLYSLGVVAYQALAGRPPFDAPDVPAVLAKHLTLEAPPLEGVPPRLAEVVAQCLAKRPEDRPATGEELAELVSGAIEAPSGLPAALRMWAERRDPLAAAYTFWSAIFGIITLMHVAQWIATPEAAARQQLDITGPLLLALLPALPAGARALARAWVVIRAGYRVEDLRRALHWLRARRDLDEGAEPAVLPERWRRILARAIHGVSLAWFAASVAIEFVWPMPERGAPDFPARYEAGRIVLWGMLASIALQAVGIALGVTGVRSRLRALVDRARLAFWDGPAGAWLAGRLARWAVRSGGGGAVVVDRPTEIAIGLATADLFAGLPPALRGRLRELPRVVRRLEREAEAMRARAEELTRQLASVDAAHTPQLSDARRGVAEELRAAREAAERRRDAAVGALEGIRLDLLRLRAGFEDTGSLTALVDAARTIGDDVDALLAARERATSGATAGATPRLPSPPDGLPVGA